MPGLEFVATTSRKNTTLTAHIGLNIGKDSAIADCSKSLSVSTYELIIQNMLRKMTDSMDSPKLVIAMICQGDALVRNAPASEHHTGPS